MPKLAIGPVPGFGIPILIVAGPGSALGALLLGALLLGGLLTLLLFPPQLASKQTDRTSAKTVKTNLRFFIDYISS